MDNDNDNDGFNGRPPALPPRTGTGFSSIESKKGGAGGGGGSNRNLLDEEASEELEALKGWEVLKPSL
jgi:hypothetical protein